MKALHFYSLLAVAIALAGMIGVALWWNDPATEVERKVRLHLFDPDSAKFSNVTFNPEKGAGCGFVNAKNQMGGYTGRTHFILFADNTMNFEPRDRDSDDIDLKIKALEKRIAYRELINSMCKPKSSASK